jgi:excisionase family DNA binding protein
MKTRGWCLDRRRTPWLAEVSFSFGMNRHGCAFLQCMSPQPPEDELVSRLVVTLIYHWRRLEAARSNAPIRRSEPTPFVDLEPYAGLSDLRVARALGATRTDVARFLAGRVAEERSGERDRGVPAGRSRCEAGNKTWGGLRCFRLALPDDRWCGTHHPAPPQPLPKPTRLTEWDLRLRPDGDLISAVYKLTNRMDDVGRTLVALAGRLERLEERVGMGGGVEALLDTGQAAELLGLAPRTVSKLVKERRVPFIRMGSRLRFRAADLDEWLAEQTTREVRRRQR